METADEAVIEPDAAVPQETPGLTEDTTAHGVEPMAATGERTGDPTSDSTLDLLSGLEAEEHEKQAADTTLSGEEITGQGIV